MIKEGSLEIGGNKFKLWLGKKIHSLGTNLINKGKSNIVTNPTCKLVNPFTLIVNFTVNTTEKYQVILQGDYKKHYKESGDSLSELTEKEMFIIISEKRNNWFKKE